MHTAQPQGELLHLPGLDVDREEAVRAGGRLVHGRLADGAVRVAQEQLHANSSNLAPVLAGTLSGKRKMHVFLQSLQLLLQRPYAAACVHSRTVH